MYKIITSFFLIILLSACSTQYPNKNPVNELFPVVSGKSLNHEQISIPEFFKGQKVLLLIGYRQQSQFDIDRWLVGLDMTKTEIAVFEIPAIQGFFPGLFSTQIDNGMRKGIPNELWSIVITVYDDGDEIQQFTGNTNPNNARVVLLDEMGKVLHFYDRGFSVDALNRVRSKI
jgi:hypothetical protein